MHVRLAVLEALRAGLGEHVRPVGVGEGLEGTAYDVLGVPPAVDRRGVDPVDASSTACRMAAIDSSSSCAPQPQRHEPPTAQAPKPTRVMSMPVRSDGRRATHSITVTGWTSGRSPQERRRRNRKAFTTASTRTRSYARRRWTRTSTTSRRRSTAKVADPTIRSKGTGGDERLRRRRAARAAHLVYVGSHGITIYGPGTKQQKVDDAYYRTLDLAQQTGWDEFRRR